MPCSESIIGASNPTHHKAVKGLKVVMAKPIQKARKRVVTFWCLLVQAKGLVASLKMPQLTYSNTALPTNHSTVLRTG
jgi:hypothetical protein